MRWRNYDETCATNERFDDQAGCLDWSLLHGTTAKKNKKGVVWFAGMISAITCFSVPPYYALLGSLRRVHTWSPPG